MYIKIDEKGVFKYWGDGGLSKNGDTLSGGIILVREEKAINKRKTQS